MLLSSCVPWRHREWDSFRAECPDGDASLQRVVWERFDEAIEWLERTTGVEPVWQDTNNPRTSGRRYDPSSLTDALVARIGPDRLSLSAGSDVDSHRDDVDVHRHHRPLILATGGFPVRVARERGLLVRSNPWSEGDGLDYARTCGGATCGDLDELYARAMPAPAGSTRRGGLRAGRAALRRPRASHERAGRGVLSASSRLARERPRAGDRAPARRHCLVRARRPATTRRCARRETSAARSVETDGGVRCPCPGRRDAHTAAESATDVHGRVLRADATPIDGLYAAGVDVGGDRERRLRERARAGARPGPRGRCRVGGRSRLRAGVRAAGSVVRVYGRD